MAVGSSLTAEGLPKTSFAEQQVTHIFIKGKNELLDDIKKCWASL